MEGYMGTVLRVNLTKGEITKEPLKEDLAHNYVGGRGLNIETLYEEIKPGIDPLGPNNKVVFGIGPACGTLAPGNCRFTVSAKSPMSGFIGDASCGGSFAVGLKYAGYDMLIVEGGADKPVWLWIDDDNVELRDAQHLVGKMTGETKRLIERETGDPDVHTVCIGPAGENLVRFACVISDGRTAGKTGIGAVLGSKNLKAVAARGTKGVSVANRKLLEEITRDIYRDWLETPEYLKGWQRYGPGLPAGPVYSDLGMGQYKNYRWGQVPAEEIQPLHPDLIVDKYYLKPRSCFFCPVACNHVFVMDKGPYAGTFAEDLAAPIGHYGPRIGVSDLDFIMKAHSISDEYGVDEMEMASVIGYVMECFEAGILTTRELGGLRMQWGKCDDIMQLIEIVVHREGIGDLLAEGPQRASEVIGKGSERYVMNVKGISLTSRDPRGSKGWALGEAVSSRGADHCRYLIADIVLSAIPELPWLKEAIKGYKGMNRLSEEGQAAILKWHEDVRAFQHCLEMCIFVLYSPHVIWTRPLSRLYNALTGFDIGENEVNLIGERVINLERAFNIREGLTREDDTLPARFLKEPMPDGPIKGQMVKLDPMIDEYYELRGWEKNTGFPTREKLEELGLKEVADELDGMDRLGHAM